MMLFVRFERFFVFVFVCIIDVSMVMLKVSQQCKQAYAKASRILGLINRSIKNKDSDILLSLYKSLVRPHLEY